jgi:deoxyribonuclease-4
MKKIKFGLKLWSTNIELIDQATHLIDEKIFDYIELFVIPDTQLSPFMIDVPYIIHIPHEKFGVNIGDPNKREYNLQKIDESITWADTLNAKYLILHAGHGSMKHATDVLREIADDRLLIENMPKVGLNDEPMIGYSPAQIEELIGAGDRGLCLDLNHAAKAAVSLGVDYREYVQDFLVFDPTMFHISDGKLDNEKDEHLNIGEGDYDFNYLLQYVLGSASGSVTVETPRMYQGSLGEDLRNVLVLKDILSKTKSDYADGT